MPSTSKSMPVFPKILLAVLVLWVVYRVGVSHHSTDHTYPPQGGDAVTPAREPESAPESAPAPRPGGPATAGQLDRYQSQLAQLQAQMSDCDRQDTAFFQRTMASGTMGAPPACDQYKPQRIAQLALLVTYITRLQTGNMHITVCQANVGLAGCESLEASASSHSSGSDEGTSAADDFDRGYIRGHSIYKDENGEEHELPTRNYYFRDRASGELIGSDQPSPPNNTRNYEQLRLIR